MRFNNCLKRQCSTVCTKTEMSLILKCHQSLKLTINFSVFGDISALKAEMSPKNEMSEKKELPPKLKSNQNLYVTKI